MDNQSVNSYDMAVENTDKISTIGDDKTEQQPYSKLSIRKTIYGIILILALGGFFSLLTQFAKDTISDEGNFTSVTFLTWISCSSTSCVFPIHAIVLMILTRQSLPQIYREAMKIYPKKNIQFFWSRIFVVATLYNIVVNLNYYPLNFTAPTDVTAVYASTLALVYILSIIFLKEPLILIRALAVCLSIAGVVLFAYADGFGSFAAIGIILAALFSLFTAFLRVYAKIIIGDASPIQSSMFVTLVSIINIFIGWIPFVIFTETGIETIAWSQIPWSPLMLANIFNVFYTGLSIIGIGITYPIFVSLGALFGLPINAIVDVIVRNQSFSIIKIISSLLLAAGFLILLIPLKMGQRISNKMIYLLTCRRVKI